jgi:hypothetical protein
MKSGRRRILRIAQDGVLRFFAKLILSEVRFFPFTEPVLSMARFFVEFTLNGVRFFSFTSFRVRMTSSEGLRVIESEGFRVRTTRSKGLRMTVSVAEH